MPVAWCVKRFRTRRLHSQQCSFVSKQGTADGGQSHEEVHPRCSDRFRRYLGQRVRSIPAGPTSAADRGWDSRLVDHSCSRAHVVNPVAALWRRSAGEGRKGVSHEYDAHGHLRHSHGSVGDNRVCPDACCAFGTKGRCHVQRSVCCTQSAASVPYAAIRGHDIERVLDSPKRRNRLKRLEEFLLSRSAA
jgi:hypothetical protein